MKERISLLKKEVEEANLGSREELDAFKQKYLSKKGSIQGLFADFKNIDPSERKETGQLINDLKQTAQEKHRQMLEQLESQSLQSNLQGDLSRPANPLQTGSRHPISLVRSEIIEIFNRIGFTVSYGPEIEDDSHVFSKLNFVPEHPARDMQDTFFMDKKKKEDSDPEDLMLRTHTSSVQVRVMENEQPPIRTISPGRVFRNEAISARAHCIFHQVEGLYVDKDVSFADMKQTLLYFAREMFGQKTDIRLRPSYFPFTEPSGEMDVNCKICGGKGCNICKYTGWLEILGCGMVDPAVLQNCGIDPEIYTGFAFGMGIERIAMLKYSVNDLRLYFENDIRFLNQFTQA